MLWLVVSTPLIYLIYTFVEPTYEAFSLLQIEPTTQNIFERSAQNFTDSRAVEPYLQTQVQLITSPAVLDQAISTDARIGNLRMIKESKDPKADLREKMVVEIVDKRTYLIRVALASPNPEAAAAIVNAVVGAYLEQNTDYHRSANKVLHKSLTEERDKLTKEINDKKAELRALVAQGNVELVQPPKPNPVKEDDPDGQPAFTKVTEDQYAQTTNKLLQTEMDLLESQAMLEVAQGRLDKISADVPENQAQETADQIAARVKQEFLKDPEVIALAGEIKAAQSELETLKSKLTRPSDPAIRAVAKRLNSLTDDWTMSWEQKRPMFEARLLDEDVNMQPDRWKDKIAEIQFNINKLKKQKASLAERLEKLTVATKTKNSDTLSAAMVNQELSSLLRMQELVVQKLEQLEFETRQDVYRISRHDSASVPLTASNNKRLKFMAAAPVGVLFLMLGLFLILEVKAERVADPEALSTRMQSEVYALPPLPTARSIRNRSASQADDQIEQFIQRLDHLRFAVCGNPADLEKGRCVLITSAIGREGKTTLAAQLAARCGNAGMSTLLIDADLRRTGLCSLLDVPEGSGLSDALIHDDPAATDLVIPVQGGTFHLLPAGTPTQDASRVLQNRKLGLLVTQFRQIYDLVIIDSPPVLPVPDALILGRWADGAVLAVRYDISRFPQVERARRQLDSAGICVLGTVINGMRNSDSYYGGYSYSRRPIPQPSSTTAI